MESKIQSLLDASDLYTTIHDRSTNRGDRASNRDGRASNRDDRLWSWSAWVVRNVLGFCQAMSSRISTQLYGDVIPATLFRLIYSG